MPAQPSRVHTQTMCSFPVHVKRPLAAITFYWLGIVLLLLSVAAPQQAGFAHETPSVHDVVAEVRARLANSFPYERLNALTVQEVAETLTDEERCILGETHIRFDISVPVRVYILHDRLFAESEPFEPFWLEERGFEKTRLTAQRGSEEFDAYVRAFDPGPVGLGVNSLSGSHRHYFVALEPVHGEDTIELSNLHPAYQTVGILKPGVNAFVDPAMGPVTNLSPELDGLTLLQVDPWRHRDARLTSIYTQTDYPASDAPDQIVLTWSDDPQTTQTIQWRTSTNVSSGMIAYVEKKSDAAFRMEDAHIIKAVTRELHTPRVVNDQRVNRHTATLTGLAPDTTYWYALGASADAVLSAPATFTTAPATAKPFSFIYMGDPQNGFDQWAFIVRRAEEEKPDAAFCLIAGDLVNRGADRDDWDDFFFNAGDYFMHRTLVPALGNHEYQLSDGTLLYNDIFTLLQNGPDLLPPQHAYRFEYGNALFVILDSNKAPADQATWLDETLGASDALWKFVSFHHPIYSSSPRRDNPIHREAWVPIFDKHNVDMVLQGHDHAYLRTWPMRDNKRMDAPGEGTIYIVSVSGTKMYDMGEFDYAARAIADTSTFQTIDIVIDGNRLIYKAYDVDGNCLDEITIEK